MPPLQPRNGHLGLILPLCTSSATIGLALFQYPLTLSFLQARPSIAGAPLSHFWASHIKGARAVVTPLILTTAVGGALCARWLRTHQTLETTDVSFWFTCGSILAVAHLAFLPFVAGLSQRMVQAGSNASTKSEDEIDAANREELQTYLMVHTVRTFLVDLPALWCFAEGVALSFWVI